MDLLFIVDICRDFQSNISPFYIGDRKPLVSRFNVHRYIGSLFLGMNYSQVRGRDFDILLGGTKFFFQILTQHEKYMFVCVCFLTGPRRFIYRNPPLGLPSCWVLHMGFIKCDYTNRITSALRIIFYVYIGVCCVRLLARFAIAFAVYRIFFSRLTFYIYVFYYIWWYLYFFPR